MSPSGYEVRVAAGDDERARAFELRYRELRAPWGQARGSERDEADEIPERYLGVVTFVAVAADGRVLGTGRVQRNRESPDEAQCRYLAVDPAERGRGVATALVRARVELARAWGVALVWCNARPTSRGIYERADFVSAGPGPTLFGTIEQTRMELRLR